MVERMRILICKYYVKIVIWWNLKKQQNHEYAKISETASSLNQQAHDRITDKLTNVLDKNKTDFKIDMDKSRQNAIYCSRYDFPLFTVMGKVEEFKPFLSSYGKQGLYYIEMDSRKWLYSHCMVR